LTFRTRENSFWSSTKSISQRKHIHNSNLGHGFSIQHFFDKFDKTETPLAAVLLGGKEKPEDFFLILVVRGLLGPLMA
jgi:hypothetical protein